MPRHAKPYILDVLKWTHAISQSTRKQKKKLSIKLENKKKKEV